MSNLGEGKVRHWGVHPTEMGGFHTGGVASILFFRSFPYKPPSYWGTPIYGNPQNQWEFQDPKMEVLYHVRPYCVGIFPYTGLFFGPIYGRYLRFRFLKWPLGGHWCHCLLVRFTQGIFGNDPLANCANYQFHHPSNPPQPIQQPYVKRSSKL